MYSAAPRVTPDHLTVLPLHGFREHNYPLVHEYDSAQGKSHPASSGLEEQPPRVQSFKKGKLSGKGTKVFHFLPHLYPTGTFNNASAAG